MSVRPPTEPAPVEVVVVAYGPPDVLAGALGLVAPSFHTVVVDNASSPDTAALARRLGADYHDPGANLGFAAGVNAGLARRRHPGGDVLLLNPDARITADAVRRLHEALVRRADAACAGPALYAPGSEVPTLARWPPHTPAGAWADAVGLARRRLGSKRFFLGGAVLLLRGAALEDVGLLDERFFLYADDEDWQRRARARGWTVLYCPEVRAEHAAGGTDRDPDRHRLRLHASVERFVRKWYGPAGWTLYRAGTLVGLALRVAATGGTRRRRALVLARLYLAGPDRTARRRGALPALSRTPPGPPR